VAAAELLMNVRRDGFAGIMGLVFSVFVESPQKIVGRDVFNTADYVTNNVVSQFAGLAGMTKRCATSRFSAYENSLG
jgi:hypothetical protein